MKKTTPDDFVTGLPKLKGTEKASPATKKAIRFFNGKAKAVDLLEKTGSKNFKMTSHVKTLNERFFDAMENKKVWSTVALAITTAFIVAVAYWGIKQ